MNQSELEARNVTGAQAWENTYDQPTTANWSKNWRAIFKLIPNRRKTKPTTFHLITAL